MQKFSSACTAGLSGSDAEVMVCIHVQFGPWQSAAKVPLAFAQKSAEDHLLPQLFLMIFADLCFPSGNHLFSIGISPEVE